MKESNAFSPLFWALSFAIAGILHIHSFDDGSSMAVYWGLFLSILRLIRLYLVDNRGLHHFFLIVFWKIISILVYLHWIIIINNLTMKRLLLVAIMVLSAIAGIAQTKERINVLKERQKVLKLTTELNKMQLAYEKEKANNVELSKKASEINLEANVATAEFNTNNPSSTVKDAKSTIKRLKETKKINKKLAKSQKTLVKMEKKIAKVKAKIDDCNKRIKFVNNE